MKKVDAIDLLRESPEEIDPEELMHRLYLKEEIDAADAAARAVRPSPMGRRFDSPSRGASNLDTSGPG
jgi:hypothetical protein